MSAKQEVVVTKEARPASLELTHIGFPSGGEADSAPLVKISEASKRLKRLMKELTMEQEPTVEAIEVEILLRGQSTKARVLHDRELGGDFAFALDHRLDSKGPVLESKSNQAHAVDHIYLPKNQALLNSVPDYASLDSSELSCLRLACGDLTF
ncbi:uncharacterized protein A4U43_C04F7430 [Asparagus officinalis]|uniref:Uncharacterized protein n=1 Tax=Asparagus officinalis TaxID=4686 RepID=A0A5P1EZ04_ASPOF|nr:uncharacterized protein A4U43_C04F7430 [Asparagus officinalis]